MYSIFGFLYRFGEKIRRQFGLGIVSFGRRWMIRLIACADASGIGMIVRFEEEEVRNIGRSAKKLEWCERRVRDIGKRVSSFDWR